MDLDEMVIEEISPDDELPFTKTNTKINKNNIKELELEKNKFSSLIDSLEVMTIDDLCEDVEIIKGKIQQSSDNKFILFDIDLTDIIETNDLLLSSVKSKCNILDPFRKQQANMKLTFTDTSYIFNDNFSSIEFQKPIKEAMKSNGNLIDNLEDKLSIEDSPIFKFKFEKFLLERTKSLQKGLSASSIYLTFDNEKMEAYLEIKMTDNNSSTLGTIATIPINIPVNGNVSFPIDIFVKMKYDFDIELYFRDNRKSATMKIYYVMNKDSAPVNVNIWCISKIVSSSPDEIII